MRKCIFVLRMLRENFMNNPKVSFKPYIASISPYVAGKPVEETAREYGLDPGKIIKLASNENPLGMPESAKKALIEAASNIQRYPDGNAFVFRNAVAGFMQVPIDWVIAGNGSDEILGLIARVLLKPGTKCVFSQYSFSMYELSAKENGATCVEVPARDFAVDLDGMLSVIDADTRLVFITNPNNPTGLALKPADVRNFLSRVPATCQVVLDEAYMDFLPPEYRLDSVALVREFPNVMITRTFSKAYGLAGIRAGFGIAHPAVIEMMNRIRPPFNMNILAQAAAAGCINDTAFLKQVYDMNRAGAKQLETFFAQQQLRFVPTTANFILVHVGDKAAQINVELLRRGLIIRPLKSYGLDQWLRITIGTAEQNEAFINAFKEVRKVVDF